MGVKRNFTGQGFWECGYFVLSVGLDEEARLSIIQQATGIPLKSEMGKIIGKVIEFELVNPSTGECKIKGVLFDEH